MPIVRFTSNLKLHTSADSNDVAATTIAEALDAAFQTQPELRGYVLDDQGRPRKHVAVFLNGNPISDREWLSDAVQDDDEIFVMQALSGG